MPGIRKTPAGNWRASWRDPGGRQVSKTFPTKREAAAFLAKMTTTMTARCLHLAARGSGRCSATTPMSG